MNGLALFAGVGGLELGLTAAIGPRFRTVCYVEGETYAASVLVSQMEKGRLHPAPIWSDVRTFDGEPWRGKVDIITAGFPCQPWSKAGSLKKTEDSRWLWPDIERIISEVGSQFVFLENVSGLIDGGLSPVLGTLASLGYDAEWGCLKASEVGAPHRRERIFILASKTGGFLAYADSLRQPFKLESCSEGDSSKGRMEGGIAAECRGTLPDSDNQSLIRTSSGELKDSSWLCQNVADSHDGHTKQKPEVCSRRNSPFISGQDVADSNGPRSPIGLSKQKQREKGNPNLTINRSHQSRGGPHGDHWAVEPRVGRVVDGMAHRVDRIRACGNGVVPQQAAHAFRRLLERFGGV